MLLVRALTLAKGQVHGLGAMQVKPDGSLDGFIDPGNLIPSPGAGVMLIAELLDLLGTFVGEAFTLRLVLDAWPGFPVLDTESWSKSDHDQPK
jgi:hypothetical protein